MEHADYIPLGPKYVIRAAKEMHIPSNANSLRRDTVYELLYVLDIGLTPSI
jgi:hypothetical protein